MSIIKVTYEAQKYQYEALVTVNDSRFEDMLDVVRKSPELQNAGSLALITALTDKNTGFISRIETARTEWHDRAPKRVICDDPDRNAAIRVFNDAGAVVSAVHYRNGKPVSDPASYEQDKKTKARQLQMKISA